MTTYPKRNSFGRGGSGVGVAEYSSGVVGRGSFRGAIFGNTLLFMSHIIYNVDNLKR